MLKNAGKKIFDLILLFSSLGVVVVFNLFLIKSWLSGEGPADIGSIEVSYISMSKALVVNWPDLSWAPYWYLGFPFHLFYTPVLPVLVAFWKVVSGVSFWQAYRILSGVSFILGPVSVLFLVFYLTKNNIAALASGILYSILPNIFNFILPSGEVKADRFNSQFVDPRRLVNLARWGEGPHVFSLVFLPLAGLFFFMALEKRNSGSMLLAAFFIGLVALTNGIGLNALILLLASIFLVEMFFNSERRTGSLLVTIITAIFTYGLIAFWYNPSFIKTFFGEGGGALTNWLSMFPWGLALFVIGLFIVLFLLKKLIKDKAISAIFLWTFSLFLIVAVYYFSAPPGVWQKRIELMPQALRLMAEVDMGIAILTGLIIGLLAGIAFKRNKFLGATISFLLGGLVIIPCLIYGISYAPTIHDSLEANVELSQTNEKKIADWLAANVDSSAGERIFLAGNPVFYLNYFTDVWQLRGGLYQAKTNYWPEHIYYQLRIGKDGEIAKAWLEVANAKYALVSPGREIEQKEKFQTLPLLETLKDGSLVYEVQLTNTSPVKIVDLNNMKTLIPPKKADDKTPLVGYINWLRQIKTQEATFEKVNNNLYKINATVGRGQGVLVQMTADPGWRAKSENGKIEIRKDPLGFFVLVPPKGGNWQITLFHGRELIVWFGYLVTFATIVGAGLSLFFKLKISPEI